MGTKSALGPLSWARLLVPSVMSLLRYAHLRRGFGLRSPSSPRDPNMEGSRNSRFHRHRKSYLVPV